MSGSISNSRQTAEHRKCELKKITTAQNGLAGNPTRL